MPTMCFPLPRRQRVAALRLKMHGLNLTALGFRTRPHSHNAPVWFTMPTLNRLFRNAMPPANPRVFISYSHDSECHCDQVLELAQQLRRDGIAAELDQFHQEELLHWPRWCEEQMRPENADFILCVCTAEYKSRVEGKAAADVGKGVFWEGTLIYNELYDAKGNPRFVPVVLDGALDTDIPRVLRNFTEFRLGSFGLDDPESDYASLYRLLTHQPFLSAEELGPLVALPSLPVEERQTDFIALMTAGLQRIAETQTQHTESLGNIANSQASQTETLAKLWHWLKRWRVWLLASVLLLAGLGGVAWWTLPARTAHEVAYQFSAKAVATRLRDEIEQRFQTDLAAAHQANKNYEAIIELEKNRDAALNRVDDIVTFIEQGLAGTPDPIFKEATKLLELQGSDAALEYLESHRAKILANADQAALQAEAAEEKLHDSLRPLLLEAELRQGQREWETALKLLQTVADKAPQWWEARIRLGMQLYQLARYAEAEPHFRVAVALAVDVKDQAVALNDFGQMLQATNRLAEAEPLMRRALAIDENSYGTEHPEVAIRLNNLASLLQDTNRLAEAEPLMRRALAIAEKSYGPEHPDVAIALNNLATLLYGTNRLADAEPLMRRALAIDEKSLGTEHPDVAIDLNNLAQLLKDTNRLADAEPLMRRALAIDEKSYGPEHPNVAISLNNLARLLQDTNRLTEAEPLMRRALAIDEKSYGPEHPDVAIRLNNLAMLLKATNRLADAEPLMRRHLVIFLKFTRATGHEHPHMRDAIANYQQLLAQTGLKPTQITQRLAETGQLAGYTAEEWQKQLQTQN